MELLIAGLVVFVGAVVQTAIGFGIAVVAAPILVIIEPQLVPGPLIVAALVQCILMMLQNRQHLDMKGLASAFIGRLPGSALGAIVLTLVAVKWLYIGVGIIVLLAVLMSLGKFKVAPTKKSLFWASMASGFLGSTTAVGGPPMALLLQHEKAQSIRANLSGYFIYGCLISLLSLSIAGLFGWQELKISLALVPWAIAGFYICRFLPLYRLEHKLQPIILVLCGACGLFAIFKGLA